MRPPGAHWCCCHPRAGVGGSPYFRAPSAAKRQPEGASRGSSFYSVLLEFWVTDGDEPVPVAAQGGALPAQPSAGGAMW